MLRYICFCLFIGVIIFKSFAADGQNAKNSEHPGGGFGMPEVWGEATNGFQPDILIEKFETDWHIDIELFAQTNFEKNTWLKITNRVGSKLQLWLTNGVELKSTNSSVLAATNLPCQTTVSDIMRGVHPSNRRGSQWLSVVGQPIAAGKFYPSVTFFRLCDAFDISFTNDVVLQITPLIYKVETNGTAAHLVEFPPIKMKLLSNGKVQKLP
jgi:hypothetical protein